MLPWYAEPQSVKTLHTGAGSAAAPCGPSYTLILVSKNGVPPTNGARQGNCRGSRKLLLHSGSDIWQYTAGVNGCLQIALYHGTRGCRLYDATANYMKRSKSMCE